MQLEQQFTIPTSVDHAWDLMLDVERIAPCFPGAKVTAADGETVNGQVRVKLGPILLTYAGILKFVERDDTNHRLVMDGKGVDAKGNGSASAQVTAHLTATGEGSTLCNLVTDLNITGRPAQFGRGMMLEIGNNILGKFSANLAEMLSADEAPSARAGDDGGQPVSAVGSQQPEEAVDGRPSQPGVHRLDAPAAPRKGVVEAEALDLLRAASGATLKRAVPALLAVAVVIAVIVWAATR